MWLVTPARPFIRHSSLYKRKFQRRTFFEKNTLPIIVEFKFIGPNSILNVPHGERDFQTQKLIKKKKKGMENHSKKNKYSQKKLSFFPAICAPRLKFCTNGGVH